MFIFFFCCCCFHRRKTFSGFWFSMGYFMVRSGDTSQNATNKKDVDFFSTTTTKMILLSLSHLLSVSTIVVARFSQYLSTYDACDGRANTVVGHF